MCLRLAVQKPDLSNRPHIEATKENDYHKYDRDCHYHQIRGAYKDQDRLSKEAQNCIEGKLESFRELAINHAKIFVESFDPCNNRGQLIAFVAK